LSGGLSVFAAALLAPHCGLFAASFRLVSPLFISRSSRLAPPAFFLVFAGKTIGGSLLDLC